MISILIRDFACEASSNSQISQISNHNYPTIVPDPWRSRSYNLVYAIPGEDSEEGFALTNYGYIALYTPKDAVRQASGGILGAAELEAKRIQTPTGVTQGEVSEAFGKIRVNSH